MLFVTINFSIKPFGVYTTIYTSPVIIVCIIIAMHLMDMYVTIIIISSMLLLPHKPASLLSVIMLITLRSEAHANTGYPSYWSIC